MKSELGKLAKGVSSEETDTKNPGFIDKIVNSLNKIQRESFIIKGNGLKSRIEALSKSYDFSKVGCVFPMVKIPNGAVLRRRPSRIRTPLYNFRGS